VSAWTADRLPISVAPLAGEALESWIAAYARRLRTTSAGLIAHLGLGGVRVSQMALRLSEHEAATLERGTGVSAGVLAAMTLAPYDGLAIAIHPRRRALLGRLPAGRFGSGRARWCPPCLHTSQGRGPLAWRLPWSFACPVHAVLLEDRCPACHRPPNMWTARRLGPRAGGACTRDDPAAPPRRGCGADLTSVAATPLPPGGLVLKAHQHLAALTTSPPQDRPAALTALREIYATAVRVLRGLHTIPGQAPPIVGAVLEETRCSLPGPPGAGPGAGPGDDARSAAVGAALALVALDNHHPDHAVLFDWILRADRTLLGHRQYVPGIGAIARRWAWSGPGMISRVLRRLDRDANLHARLRYTTATPQPRWPDLPAEVITRRAAMIPAMLWPAWTMRLLPTNPGHPPADPESGPESAAEGPRTGSFTSFRRGCASFLLLPGGPPRLNFERASPLLGNHSAETSRGAVERIVYRGRDRTPLASVLAQLALALDANGSPIDYARRRAVFTSPDSVILDPGAYTRLRLQHGWSAGYAPREAVLRWYVLVLLTGEHPAIAGTRKPFGHHCTDFRYSAPGPLRAFLHQQAKATLTRHGITEPVTWQPPPHWGTWHDWPGIDPASIPTEDLSAVLQAKGSVHQAAAALGLTPEHLRLWCETTGIGPPAATANGLPGSQARADILSPQRLRELYEHHNTPVREIAVMAGCATVTIHRLLRIDQVPKRRNYRRPPPQSGITREWLRREYVDNQRSIGVLARERGVRASYLKSLAANWDLPIREPRHPSIDQLDLPQPPSPAMRAVTMRQGTLNLSRVTVITQIPGHDSIAAAARAIYGGRDGALRQMVHQIEQAAGFTIIDRTSIPLVPTQQGAAFIREALQILRAAHHQPAPPMTDCS
jgi:hypothetical protein